MSNTKPNNTSLVREVVDEEAVEEMLVDIEQAAKRKDLLIERTREMEKRDAEILRVSLNLLFPRLHHYGTGHCQHDHFQSVSGYWNNHHSQEEVPH